MHRLAAIVTGDVDDIEVVENPELHRLLRGDLELVAGTVERPHLVDTGEVGASQLGEPASQSVSGATPAQQTRLDQSATDVGHGRLGQLEASSQGAGSQRFGGIGGQQLENRRCSGHRRGKRWGRFDGSVRFRHHVRSQFRVGSPGCRHPTT